MIPMRLMPDAIERIKEYFPHLNDSFLGFSNIRPYLGKIVYVDTLDFNSSHSLHDRHGAPLVGGLRESVVTPLTHDKTFDDYL